MSAVSERYPTYKRVTTLVIILLFVFWTGYVMLVPSAHAKEPGSGVANGAKAPDFELKTPDGKSVKLSDFKGKAVMLNFFATWCPPCRAEMPTMEAAYEASKDKGFVILAVNLGEPNVTVTQFMEKMGVTFPVVIDENDRVSKLYDIVPLPTSYFIDKNGNVYAKTTGEIKKEQLNQLIQQLTK
jgi:peroxiredoxin